MSQSLWTTPLEKLTFQDVVAFCKEQITESATLDYKEQLTRGEGIGKIVSSFANTHGGIVIYGVAAGKDRKPELSPAGRDLGADPREKIINACRSHIMPCPAFDVSDPLKLSQTDPAAFIVVRVPASADAPHAMDDSTVVYIRVHDQCDPQKATVARLAEMLDRRKGRAAVQSERQKRLRKRVMNAMGFRPISVSDPKNFGYYMTVSIGPTIIDRPAAELGQLRGFDPGGEVFHTDWTPFSDGYYQALPGELWGLAVDVYGNVTVVRRATKIAKQEVLDPWPIDCGIPFDAVSGKTLHFVRASDLLEPLVVALNVAGAFFELCGYFGTANVRFFIHRLGGLSIRFGKDRVAKNRTDKSLLFEANYLTTSFANCGWEPLVELSGRVLHAWGAQVQKSEVEKIADMAEREHFNFVHCEKHRRPGPELIRPLNHDECLHCRRKRKEEAAAAAAAEIAKSEREETVV